MLEELKETTDKLAKGRALGPDGVPIEFFQLFQDKVGPTMLQILNNAMHEGLFNKLVTQGLIIFLPKKGDLCLLSNMRPLTLLNMLYKLYTKAFQLHLLPVLQKFIGHLQNVFFLGRSIHHTILLINELLHRAIADGQDFILLKLDIHKTFDKLEWFFLFRVLDHIGHFCQGNYCYY